MACDADHEPLDAVLKAADAKRGRWDKEVGDFAKRLNGVCVTFEEAYGDLRRVDEQLRENQRQGRPVDWHFVLASLKAATSYAGTELEVPELDRNAEEIEIAIRETLLRLVREADQGPRLHEAVTLIQARTGAEQGLFRRWALEARQSLYYDLIDAVARRAVGSFPESQAEARSKYSAALDAHLLRTCDQRLCHVLIGLLHRTTVPRAALETEIDRLDNARWRFLVRALLDAYPHSLTTKDLQDKCGLKDPGGALRHIRMRSSLLERVIVMPGGKAKGGYRLQHLER